MFAYCNNDPVASEDPTGHYIGHRPIMVCDYSNKKVPPKIISMEQAVRDITHSAKYSQEAWDGLDSNGRWDLIVEYVREVEKAMGLEPVDIRGFFDSSGTAGYYLHSEKTLFLSDILFLNRELALNTVRHELRHYYQNTLCDDLPRNYSCVFTVIIIQWDNNRQPGNYISDGPGYDTQPVEEDANNWADITG